MKQREAIEFIEDNKDALTLLADKMRQIDTVRDCSDEIELRGRQRAIDIISSWMIEIFGIKDGDLISKKEEDNLYIRLAKGRDEA